MAFRDVSDYIYQGGASGAADMENTIGNYSIDGSFVPPEGAKDYSSKFRTDSVASTNLDVTNTVNESSQGSSSPISGVIAKQWDLGIFSVNGIPITEAQCWKLEKNSGTNRVGDGITMWKLWIYRKINNYQNSWTTRASWEWESGYASDGSSDEQSQIDHAELIVINYYMLEAMSAGLGQTESNQKATEFVSPKGGNGGNGSGVGASVFVAIVAGMALFLIN